MCKNIIAIIGKPKSGHIKLAYMLSLNSAVDYLYPWTDNPSDIYLEYHQVSKGTLDILIEEHDVLTVTMIDGYRFVYFKDQLKADYNILILDDYTLAELRSTYERLYSIKVWSKGQEDSERVGVYLYNHEFSEVFEYGVDEVEDLEWRIEEYFMNNHDME